MISALGQSATPRLANLYAQGDFRQFRRLLGRLAGIGLLLGFCGVLGARFCGHEILRLVYGSQFSAESVALVWVMAAAAAGYVASFLGYGLTAARRFKIQLPIFSGLTALTVVFCFWLVPRAGAIGAAQAMLLTGVAQGLVMAYAVNRALRHQGRAVGGMTPAVRSAGIEPILDRLAFGFLWAFVLAVPWEGDTLIGGFAVTRWLGLAAVGAAALRFSVKGSVRKPHALHGWMAAFVLWASLSLAWTRDAEMTLSRIGSYAQLAIMVWLIWELALTEERWRALLYAYCMGACVSSINAIRNLATGMSGAPESALEDGRYAPAGFDQNEFALLLALSIPMAVYLLTRRQSMAGRHAVLGATASGDRRHSADRVARRTDFAGRGAHSFCRSRCRCCRDGRGASAGRRFPASSPPPSFWFRLRPGSAC